MSGSSVPIGQARNKLSEIVEAARRAPVTITRRGVPAAVVMSPADFESLTASIELLSSAQARERLLEIEDQGARGVLEFVSNEEAQRQLLA